jgi:hypothetical protein
MPKPTQWRGVPYRAESDLSAGAVDAVGFFENHTRRTLDKSYVVLLPAFCSPPGLPPSDRFEKRRDAVADIAQSFASPTSARLIAAIIKAVELNARRA